MNDIERLMMELKTPSCHDLREPYIEALLCEVGAGDFESTTMADDNFISRLRTHTLFSLVTASDEKKQRAAAKAVEGLNRHRANFGMKPVKWPL